MAKFHINKKGDPAQCRATTKACPLGGEHFDSAEAAMENQMAEAMSHWDAEKTPKSNPEFAHMMENLPRALNVPKSALRNETPETLAAWTQENAHRIYPALVERGWEDDSASRETLFELTSQVLNVSYDDLYDRWLQGPG